MKTYEISLLTLTSMFAGWYLLKSMVLSGAQEPERGTGKSLVLGLVFSALAVAEYFIFSKGA